MNRWFLDGARFGNYPDELPGIFGDAWPVIDPADFKEMTLPIDFVGVNYYTRGIVRDDPRGQPFDWHRIPPKKRGATETGWEVHAPSFTKTLTWVKERYGDIPLYVTENGSSFPDPPTARKAPLPDPKRVAYLKSHLAAAADAIAEGVDLRGYFAWSLLDNFEWGSYAKRFGLIHVNYRTQKRTPKTSAHLYRDVIATNGGVLSAKTGSSPRRGAP